MSTVTIRTTSGSVHSATWTIKEDTSLYLSSAPDLEGMVLEGVDPVTPEADVIHARAEEGTSVTLCFQAPAKTRFESAVFTCTACGSVLTTTVVEGTCTTTVRVTKESLEIKGVLQVSEPSTSAGPTDLKPRTVSFTVRPRSTAVVPSGRPEVTEESAGSPSSDPPMSLAPSWKGRGASQGSPVEPR